VICIFSRQIDGPLTSLVKQVDSAIAENPKLKAFVVVLTDDEARTAAALERLAADQSIKNVPLTVYPDTAGPEIYQIAEEAGVTVMMWKGTEVKVNHAYAPGKFTDAEAQALAAEIPAFLSN